MPLSHDLEDQGRNHPTQSRAIEFSIIRRRIKFGRSGTLLVSRVYEQGVLGLASVLLAWRLGVGAFAPVSALLVVNSLSITLSDFGLGTDLMRRKVGNLAPNAVWRVRVFNAAIVSITLTSGLLLSGETKTILYASGFIWLSAAEARIRKNALVRLDRATRAAIVEIFGATALVVCVVIAVLQPDSATVIVSVGLILKNLVEALLCRGWGRVLRPTGEHTWSMSVWISSLLGFAISNVDFLIVAWVISPEAFSVYSLGFRISALFVSQISYVVNRVALVDFGEAHRDGTLGMAYTARRRQLFALGIAAGALTVIATPLLVAILGRQWLPVIGVTIVLSIVTPWRMCTGLGLSTAIAVGHAAQLSRWEASRLVIATSTLALAGLGGLRPFAIAAAAIVVLTTIGYDQAALRYARMRERSALLLVSPVAGVLIAVAATLLPFTR